MKKINQLKYLFTLLNIIVGWHLLYEGVVKIMDPDWSSASYLLNAQGFPAKVFHFIAETHWLLQITDVLNIVVLTVVGLLLITGLLVRQAAVAGAVLIGLYYLANIPFQSTGVGYGTEGHYLLVNKNLVEVVILIIIAFIPKDWYYGIGNLINYGMKIDQLQPVQVPNDVNHNLIKKQLDRRTIVKNLISLPILGGFAFAVAKNHGWRSFEEENLLGRRGTDATSSPTIKVQDFVDLNQLKAPVPKGKIGGLDVGRVICGGNLISGFSHSRDLIYVSQLLKKYFNEKKVMDTFWLCEECGINTTSISVRPDEIKILNNYWKQGGKIQWFAQAYPKDDNYRESIDFALDNGAKAVMVMGNIGDAWVREGKYELLAKTIDYIKSKGVPAGLAGHEIATIQGAEKYRVGADFYMKTLHSRNYWSWQPEQSKEKLVIDNYSIDNYWDRNPDETIAYMETLDKPWIAFKILAAGAVHPKNGFRYVFEKGADFACVGMFDYQIVENANLLTEMLRDENFNRKRSWMA